MVDRGGHETSGHTVETSIYIYILHVLCYMMMIAFITFKSSLVPLLECL